MDTAALLLELYGRVPPLAHEAVDGLDPDGLVWQPAPGANTIGWLVWHTARVQDHDISELTGDDQLWVTGDRAAGFGLDPDPSNTGYGHGAADVLAVRPESAAVLLDYLAATDQRSTTFIAGLSPDRLDEIVDRRWDPPVTLGVRLVSVADDCLQHVGQAAYVRGLRAG
jgi:hypothetical protein